MAVLEQLTQAYGQKPSQVIASGRVLTKADLDKVIEARQSQLPGVALQPAASEIWPLISHHGFNQHSLFGLGDRGQIQQKTLALLLAHDGLVASDPLIDVERAAAEGKGDLSLVALQEITAQVSRVESLIEKNYLRFETTRPTFTDASRQSILDLFSISPDLLLFVNFEQAYFDVQSNRAKYEALYLKQIREVFTLMGLDLPRLDSAAKGRELMSELASAIIHVSWQLAVCSQNRGCDLTLTRSLEQKVFDEILIRAAADPAIKDANRGRGRTRHVKRLSIGDLPNLDAVGLSVADAIALRRDDAFESFREELRDAMSKLPGDEDSGQLSSEKNSAFQEQMLQAARRLRESTKKSSFGHRMKDVSIPAAIGAISTTAFALPAGLTTSAFAGLTTSAAVVLANWLQTRRQDRGDKVALRYFSSLGGLGVPRFGNQPRSAYE